MRRLAVLPLVVLAGCHRTPAERVAVRTFVAPAIAYQPRGYRPDGGHACTEDSVRDDLTRLRADGFRSLVTYGAAGVLASIPRIARRCGFDGTVIMGVWDPASAEERLRAAAQADFVSAYCIGNEGLGVRYTSNQLRAGMEALKQTTSRPVSTSEPIESYLWGRFAGFLQKHCDWLFPIAHPHWSDVRNPRAAAEWLALQYDRLVVLTGRPVIIKEAGFPSAGAADASEAAQAAFFDALAPRLNRFFYFEAFDQPWKTTSRGDTSVEPYWGLYRNDGLPKLAALHVRRFWREPTPRR